MILLGFKELVSEEITKQERELYSLVDFDRVMSSRDNYLIYLQWLISISVHLETQIEGSPLADLEDFDLVSRFRSPLLASDFHSLLGEDTPFPRQMSPEIQVFDDTPGLGSAAGALYTLEYLQLDHKSIKRRLFSIGVRGRSVTRFYSGNSWAKSRRSEKLATWIDHHLSAREKAEAIEGTYVTGQAFVDHFATLRDFLTPFPQEPDAPTDCLLAL
ncbi:MAG: hypothetical protein P1U86_12925 [Verrucomicrobiales bacterium]|nr:hypothetical protein [Verrucomicrobiales bacterium]